jgi:hypothetical protein
MFLLIIILCFQDAIQMLMRITFFFERYKYWCFHIFIYSIHELFSEEQVRMRKVTLLEKKGTCRSSYQLTDKPDTHSERHVFFGCRCRGIG